MLDALNALVAPAMMERLTLVFNHVLGGEPVAVERMKPHRGRCIRLHFDRWPGLLPPPPAFAFRITPAGLLEWRGLDAPSEADLHVRVDASNPALLALGVLAGQTPPLEIQGDATLATDVNWLAANLRWDVAADLERLFGPRVAHQLERAGAVLARGLRAAVQQAGDLRPGPRPGRS